jgi:hypothetical protein
MTGGSCRRITNSDTYGRAAAKNVRDTFVARCATWKTMRGSLKYSTTTKAAQRTMTRTTPSLKWTRALGLGSKTAKKRTTTAPEHAQRATLQWRATQEKMLRNDLTSSLSALHQDRNQYFQNRKSPNSSLGHPHPYPRTKLRQYHRLCLCPNRALASAVHGARYDIVVKP